MKLELKHLAPYLPYKLIIQHKKELSRKNRKDKLTPFTKEMEGLDLNIFTLKVHYDFEYKPILRPLSDLTKAEFCDKIADDIAHWYCGSHDNPSNEEVVSNVILEHDILQLEFTFVQWCIKNHFDVFGLIEKGLAIDINTIEP